MKNNNIMISNKRIDKITNYMAVPLLAVLVGTSCEINHPIYEISAPGYTAASIYWDVPVTNVIAGDEVEFFAEYWTVDESIEYLGVWYGIEKTLKYSLIFPESGYSFTLDSTEQVRDFLEIKTFNHAESNYDPDKKAFAIRDSFPVSYTLAATEYNNPSTFNQEQFNLFVPEVIQQQFIDNLFPQLTYQNLRNLLVINRPVVEAEVFESYFDVTTVGETTVHELKAEAEEIVKGHLSGLPFGDIIYNRNRQYYAIEFSQGYQLSARFRIVNGNQVENFSETKTISVF